MLPKDLLEVTKRRPNIRPKYRDVDEYRPVAESVIETYVRGAERGESRGEIADTVAALETHETFKLVRGLSELLERRSTFEQRAPAPPADLRAAAFERGFVTSAEERTEVVSAVADAYDLAPTAVEDGLWADREEEELLASTPETSPEELLREYNRSLTQTLLFDAVELEFTASGNFQELFGLMKYLGLMYRVDEGLAVTVTGPAALFKQTRKYGTSLAKLVPSVMKADEWQLTAQVETEVGGETRIYEFEVDSGLAHLFPAETASESFDSEVERDFATRIDSLADGWTVRREPAILRAGERVMIPDFSFERDRGGSDTAFYLEVVGFWTPEYLAEKLAKVRTVESERPMVLAVDQSLNCTAADFDDANVEQVFFYDGAIPVKPVLSRLHAIEDRRVERDLRALDEGGVEIPTGEVTAVEDLAEAHGVEPEAIRRHLDEHYPGVVSNDRYVPDAVLETIGDAVDSLDSPTLADVAPILERYGVAQSVLDAIGYTVRYTSLDEAEADVRKAARSGHR